MKYKIVSDSAADNLTLDAVPFFSVPLHIIIDQEDFVDNVDVDIPRMEAALSSCKGSSTACPGTEDWIRAFENAENVFCVTITSALSGSYASAQAAKMEYEELYPDRRVYLIDSLSTGPEMLLIIEKLQKLILAELEGDDIYREVQSYTQHTHLLFSLESLENLAKNGRVNKAVAKLAGLLGIRVVGKASPKGELEILTKCRGEQRSIQCLIKHMKDLGYTDGRVRIAHNQNEEAAQNLMREIKAAFPVSDIQIRTTRALCSYYAEKGGLLVGFEG